MPTLEGKGVRIIGLPLQGCPEPAQGFISPALRVCNACQPQVAMQVIGELLQHCLRWMHSFSRYKDFLLRSMLVLWPGMELSTIEKRCQGDHKPGEASSLFLTHRPDRIHERHGQKGPTRCARAVPLYL